MERELSDLVAHLLEHPDDSTCRRELEALLAERPEFVGKYVEQWRVHCLLEWSLAPAPESHVIATTVPSECLQNGKARRWLRLMRIAYATAAAMALVAIGSFCYWRYAPQGEVVSTRDIRWAEGVPALDAGDSFRRGVLESSAGSCVLRFDSGVELICDGAFRLRVLNDMLVELERGKVRAKVPPGARGFSIDTPDTLLVDQGTEFGVNAAAGDGTKVVVFQGEVDVHTKHLASGGSMRRLSQGEAAQLLSGRGRLDRVTQVISGGPPANWSAGRNDSALFSIADNIRAADSLKYYNIVVGGLHEDVPAWVDRAHEWNGITPDGMPEFIRGADYVQTFNDDRYNPSFTMTVTVNRPATLYIFIDNRVSILPEWLLKDFEDTGADLGLDEGWYVYHQMESARGAGQSIDQTFSIWKREVPRPSRIELGNIESPAHFGMYGLAAKSLDSNSNP